MEDLATAVVQGVLRTEYLTQEILDLEFVVSTYCRSCHALAETARETRCKLTLGIVEDFQCNCHAMALVCNCHALAEGCAQGLVGSSLAAV